MAEAAFTPGARPPAPPSAPPMRTRKVAREPRRMSAFSDTRAGSRPVDTRAPYAITRNARASANPNQPTVSDTFNAQYESAGLQPPDYTDRPPRDNQARDTARIEATTTAPVRQPSRYRKILTRVTATQAGTPGTARARLAVLRVNRVAWWAFGGFAVLQFLLGLVSLVFFAIGAGFAAAADTWIGKLFAPVIGLAISFFIDNDAPASAMGGYQYAPAIALLMFIMLFALMQYIWLIMTYYITGIRAGVQPVFGTGAVAKISSIILGMVLYTFPFTNLFPWIYIYTFVMIRYPK